MAHSDQGAHGPETSDVSPASADRPDGSSSGGESQSRGASIAIGNDHPVDDSGHTGAGLGAKSNPQSHGDGDVASENSGRGKRRRKRRRKKRGLASVESGQAQSGSNQPSDLKSRVLKDSTPHSGGAHQSAARNTNNIYAALDLGTNNCRLLVAVPTKPGTFRVIDAFSRIVRLGEGFGASGRLSDAAMDRAIEALKVCCDKLYSRPIKRARLIATEACRSAENGAEFLNRVRESTGLDLEIVDRETEARLAVSGCASLVDRAAKSVVLFDIGGGSSEIALVDAQSYRGGRLADHIAAWTSLPIGVVTMAEKFGGRDVSHQKFQDMIAHATKLLQIHSNDDLLASMQDGRAPVAGQDFHLIGTSGTVTTLAGIHLDLPRYDRRRVDGLWMSGTQVDSINNQLLNWTFEERSANACIGSDRADLVLAGCAILEAIRNVWPSERLRVADRGLREGLLTEMMAGDGVWRRRRSNGWKHQNRRNGGRNK